jgi:Flp pilus assembly protein TadG
MIEMAVLFPLLAILVFGIVDVGRLLYTQITLNEAVQEGSIYAGFNPTDPAGARQRVIESVDKPQLALANVAVECPGAAVRVRVSHDMDPITPFLTPAVVTLTAEATSDIFSTDPCQTAP